MKIGVVTLFPKAFDYILDAKKSGLVGETLSSGKNFFLEDLRDFGEGRHKVVDAPPYGGSDGMIFKPEPLERAFESLADKMHVDLDKAYKVYLDPKGKSWTQKQAESLIYRDQEGQKKGEELSLILLCGRYGGVDQRFLDIYINESISLGRFILNGGELPALCLLESLVRIMPKTLKNSDSVEYDSFSCGLSGGLEPKLYTRPQTWKDLEVPSILLSGHHENIEKNRRMESLKLTESWFEREMQDLVAHFERFKEYIREHESEDEG